jgi:hypothetical protein
LNYVPGAPCLKWLLEEGLSVKLADVPEQQIRANAGGHRSSPIHPLRETTASPDLEDGIWFIHFLVPRDAFSLLGRISKGAYPAIQENVWFGIGLASVIVFSRNADDITCLFEDSGPDIIAHEVWETERGALIRRRLLREDEGNRLGLSSPFVFDFEREE